MVILHSYVTFFRPGLTTGVDPSTLPTWRGSRQRNQEPLEEWFSSRGHGWFQRFFRQVLAVESCELVNQSHSSHSLSFISLPLIISHFSWKRPWERRNQTEIQNTFSFPLWASTIVPGVRGALQSVARVVMEKPGARYQDADRIWQRSLSDREKTVPFGWIHMLYVHIYIYTVYIYILHEQLLMT